MLSLNPAHYPAWDNPAGRATAELTALVGARVVGEHRQFRSD